MPYLCHSSGSQQARCCKFVGLCFSNYAHLVGGTGHRSTRAAERFDKFMIWPEAPVNTADVMHAQRQAHMPIFERC